MLFGELGERPSLGSHHPWHTELAGERLHSRIDDGQIGPPTADHTGDEGQGVLVVDAHLPVSAIHGRIRSGLYLGDSLIVARDVICAGAARGDDGDRDPMAVKQISCRDQLAHGFLGGAASLVAVGSHDRVALVAHDTLELQARHGYDALGQAQTVLPRLDAATVHPHVHFEEHPELQAFGHGGGRKVGGVVGIVDGDHHVGIPGQVHQSRDFLGANDLIGDEQVADSRLGHNLGFSQLGAGDADGARPKLHPGDSRAFVRFAVGAECSGPLGKVVAHA